MVYLNTQKNTSNHLITSTFNKIFSIIFKITYIIYI